MTQSTARRFNPTKMLAIDGSIGGGSVLRIGVGLAAALRKPIRIYNIRKNRPQPGLKTQHLAGLLAAAELCDADVEGAELGSQEVIFRPHEVLKEKVRVHITTAGSVGLALQPLQLACLAAQHPVRIEIDGGGTYGKWAPPLDYFRLVNFAILERFGYHAQVAVEREGFHPKGGARVAVTLDARDFHGPLELTERGELLRFKGISLASNHLRKARVAERQAEAARAMLTGYGVPIELEARYADTRSPGSGITLAAVFKRTVLGGDALGERGKPAEEVGHEAAMALQEDLESGATLDRHMSDQIIPFIALHGGRFRAPRMTEHLETNLKLIELFTGSRLEVQRMGETLEIRGNEKGFRPLTGG